MILLPVCVALVKWNGFQVWNRFGTGLISATCSTRKSPSSYNGLSLLSTALSFFMEQVGTGYKEKRGEKLNR